MFLDHSWVPSAFIVLLVIVMLAVMNFFERRTRIRAYHAASILIGAFAIYQLYANLSAGLARELCRYKRKYRGEN